MKKQKIFVPTFNLSELKSLPPEIGQYAAQIKTVYAAYQRVVRGMLHESYIPKGSSYSKFLKVDLNAWVEVYKELDEKIGSEGMIDEKANTYISAKAKIFNTILEGHKKIEDAHIALKFGNVSKFSFHLAEAGVFFGVLTLFYELINANSFELIGAAKMRISGASKGGFNSGKARRIHSLIPSSEKLRSERQRLTEANKPVRQIAAILAKKYNCTTDHIRKLLKRD